MSKELVYFTLKNEDISVHMDSEAISKELAKRGWTVRLAPSSAVENGQFKYYYYSDFDPNETLSINDPAHYSDLRMIGTKSVLISVNDTTRFSDWYREEWMKKNYKAFVVHNNLQYGIMAMPRSWIVPCPVFPIENNIEPKPFEEREFTFFIHNDAPTDRRGYDEAIKIIKTLGIKNNVYHSRHVPVPEDDKEYFSLVVENELQTDLYRTLANSKFLLYPSKGGAFERLVLEALAVGTIPIIPEAGSARETLLDIDDAVLMPVNDLFYGMYKNQYQQGNGFQPSVELSIPLIDKALKERKEIAPYKRYREYYSVKRIADLYERILLL